MPNNLELYKNCHNFKINVYNNDVVFNSISLFCSQQRSFEAAEVLECDEDEKCIETVYKMDLRTGIVPILVTDIRPKIDLKILNYIKSKNSNLKILKVLVSHGKCKLTANYLHIGFNSRSPISYPFVAIMKNHKMLAKIVSGFEKDQIDSLLKKAENPRKDDFVMSYNDFCYDLYIKLNKYDGRKRDIDPLVRLAIEASAPDEKNEQYEILGLGHAMTYSWTPLLNESEHKYQPNNKQPLRGKRSKSQPEKPSSSKRKKTG